MKSLTSIPKFDLRQLATSLEIGSEYPLAASILTAGAAKHVPTLEAQNFRAITGQGVLGKISNETYRLENQSSIAITAEGTQTAVRAAAALQAVGQTVVYLFSDQEVLGMVGIIDPIKESAATAIAKVQSEGVEVVILTGTIAKGRRS